MGLVKNNEENLELNQLLSFPFKMYQDLKHHSRKLNLFSFYNTTCNKSKYISPQFLPSLKIYVSEVQNNPDKELNNSNNKGIYIGEVNNICFHLNRCSSHFFLNILFQ